MHFDEEMGFQYLGPGITVLSPSDPRPPTVGAPANPPFPTLSLLNDLSSHTMSAAVPLPNSDEWFHHIDAPAPTGSEKEKKEEKKEKKSQLSSSATCGFASRCTHAHAVTQSPLPPAPSSHMFSPGFVSSPQGPPAAFQIQSDLRHGMTLTFPLVLALRLLDEGKALRWLTMELQHYVG